MVDLGEDEDKFESFMVPITSKLSFYFRLYNLYCYCFSFWSFSPINNF